LGFAQAPAADPLQGGYHLLYSGDKVAAARYFEDQLKSRPDDLALRYGWAMAQRGRLGDAALRPAFETALDALIDAAVLRHDEDSRDSEALFYLANAYLLRAQHRVEYGLGMIGAARDGTKARSHIEAYLKEHPEDGDAYFVLGMYNYYVDIAPAFVRFLRFLLFMPGGDRVEGLRQIERAAAEGKLFGPFARTILMEIYSGLEGRGPDAVAVGDSLQREYPHNDEVALTLAGIYGGPLLEDRVRAAAVYQDVIDRRRNDTTADGAAAHFRAILGLAGLRQEEWRIEEAIAMLTPTIEAKVNTPDWVRPQFLIRRSNYRMLLNDPTAGDDAKRVLDDPGFSRWHESASNMLKTIDQRRSSGEATTYAALIPGNRLVVDGKWDEAARAYEAIRDGDPQSPIVRYRLAYLDFARNRIEEALPAFTALAASGKAVPDHIKAQSLLYVGRIHDLAGRRDDAKRAYQRVVDDFGKERPASAARVGLITPYHRPTTTPTAR
jgi:tetratricopeptide (TPR) repeat protein